MQNIVCPVDDHGKYTEEINTLVTCDVDVFNLTGLSVLTDGNLAVIEYLKDKHVLYHQSDYVHRYPHDWRTKGPVITRATKQWFANVSPLLIKQWLFHHHCYWEAVVLANAGWDRFLEAKVYSI